MKYGLGVILGLMLTGMFLFVQSCSQRPKECIGEKELVDLLTDMTIAESMKQNGLVGELPDSVRNALSESVMRQHNVTREQLDSTMAWYGLNLDEYVRLYQRVDKRLEKYLRSEAGKQNIEIEADDLWPLSSHKFFSPLGGDNVLVFDTPGESVIGGESLDWSMVLTSAPSIDLMLGVDYEAGQSTYIKRTFRGDRRLKLSLITDTARIISRIFGYIHVERTGLPVMVDSIKLVKNPFDSTLSIPWSQKRYYGPQRHKVLKSEDSEQPETNPGLSAKEEEQANSSRSAGERTAGSSNSSLHAIQSIKSNRSRLAE